MESSKVYCDLCPDHDTTFCPVCGRADKTKLKGARLMGFVGVENSTNPKIEQFWRTGDASVFD